MYDELRQVQAELTGPGAPFEVAEVEVRGVRVKTYASAPNSLREIWLGSAAHGDADYLVYEDEHMSYAQAHRQVAQLAHWLVQNGICPGDRVAIAMRNYPEWMLAYWATISVGAAAVGVNAWWTAPELAYGMNDAKPKILICDHERLQRIQAIRSEIPEYPIIGVRVPEPLPLDVIDWATIVAPVGEEPSLPEIAIDPDEDACIFYTSGTTGRPKGAQLTHRGCVNNLLSLAYWNVAQAMAMQRASDGAPPAAPSRDAKTGQLTSLICTPLFHVTANNCIAQGMTMAGGKLVHMYKWEAGRALELIERERVTNFSGVPTMARELIAHPDFASRDTSSLNALGGGGAQLQPDLVSKIDKSVSTARPGTGYGMTETCGVITANSADFFVDKPASCGPALPIFDTKCIDTDGKTVPTGEVGELCVRGAQVIRGYLNREEETAESITDGWLHTGDIARVDEDGFIFIVDRAKDMVLRGGENVYCAEVESALFDHPLVTECAVFGVPDDRLGEEVAAVLVLNRYEENAADLLRAHCATRLAKYKIPRYIWIASEKLPRNASGKFLKRQLRDDYDLADAV
ncbi:MAG: class I adenylate-forming enzyme family protein [Myxococcales bacterium]|nr:AMP-dependent synthetase [Myxococcales bacterium]HIK83917.1 AMP-dependent synthetase [Myxococcales bacterium]